MLSIKTPPPRSIRFKSHNPVVMIGFIIAWAIAFVTPFIFCGFLGWAAVHFLIKYW